MKIQKKIGGSGGGRVGSGGGVVLGGGCVGGGSGWM